MSQKESAKSHSGLPGIIAKLVEKPVVIGNRIICLNKAGSTNTEVWKCAENSDEGLVVCADEQTAGRGRHGRQWHCPSGKGLLFSTLLKPQLDIQHIAFITSMAAVAICNVLRDTGMMQAQIKGPNDIVINGKKAGGVLTETAASGFRAAFSGCTTVVLGIGLNFSLTDEDMPDEIKSKATSVMLEAPAFNLSRAELLAALLTELDHWYGLLKSGNHSPIEHQWRSMIIRNKKSFPGKAFQII